MFRNKVRKLLWIPKVIDKYNHYINAIDLINQYRAKMTVNRPLEHRV